MAESLRREHETPWSQLTPTRAPINLSLFLGHLVLLLFMVSYLQRCFCFTDEETFHQRAEAHTSPLSHKTMDLTHFRNGLVATFRYQVQSSLWIIMNGKTLCLRYSSIEPVMLPYVEVLGTLLLCSTPKECNWTLRLKTKSFGLQERNTLMSTLGMEKMKSSIFK